MRNKTNRENTRQRKQSYAQDNIYVVRQFAYVHGVARISLLSGKKIQSAAVKYFSLSRTTTIQNPNHQKMVLHLAYRIHNGLQNGPNFFPGGIALGPPGGLSIEWRQPRNIIRVGSGRVVNRIKHNQSPQNPTLINWFFCIIC